MLGGPESGAARGASESKLSGVLCSACGAARATELTATTARLKNVKSFVERRVREDLIDFFKMM
jgi:hypothetical protein